MGLLRKTELGERYRMQDKAMNTDVLLKNVLAAGVKHFQWLNKAVENFRSDCVKFPSAGRLTHISGMLNITSDIAYALPL